ncbi:MAG TPA: hypothetical protein VKC57_16470, partial [Ktedonobacterales bacterium]|nr:hypothetical protein [Ktedonobacterales bacterium]
TLEFAFDEPESAALRIGGPLFALGSPLGSRHELRLRAGVELGLGESLLAAAVVESNLGDRWTVVPLLDAATPEILVIPSLGLGLGVPVQFLRGARTRVGGRIQLTASLPFVSLVVPFDVFADEVQTAMYGQVSF